MTKKKLILENQYKEIKEEKLNDFLEWKSIHFRQQIQTKGKSILSASIFFDIKPNLTQKILITVHCSQMFAISECVLCLKDYLSIAGTIPWPIGNLWDCFRAGNKVIIIVCK